MTKHKSIIDEYLAKGWQFAYCEDTRMIVANHHEGDQQPLFQLTSRYQPDNWGKAVAELMNGRLPT